MSLIAIILAASVVFAGLCVLGLRLEARILGEAATWTGPVAERGVAIAGLAGGVLGGAVTIAAAPGIAPVPGVIVLCGLGCWMAASGWLDGRTAWVPDALLFGLIFWCAAYALDRGSGIDGVRFLRAIAAGGGCGWPTDAGGVGCVLRRFLAAGLGTIMVGGALFALWGLQVAFRRIVMSPPDMFALVAPLMVFGLSFLAVGALMAQSLLLLCLLAVPGLRDQVDRHGAAREAAEEMGFDPRRWGPPIPLFVVAMPVLALALAAAEFWPPLRGY